MLKSLSFRQKILLAVLATVFLGFAVTLGFVNLANSQDARRQGEALAEQMAARYAEQTEQTLNESMKAAAQLAQTFEGLRQGAMPPRPTLDALQRRVLMANTGFINIWVLFEPNALDGRDAEFANTPHHDRSGRYVPYFTRRPDGSIGQEIPGGGKGEVLEYDRPGDGDYYLVPKQRGMDTITEPYEYDVAGKKMLLASFVAPIKDNNGRFIGAAGVDVPLASVQNELGKVKLFDDGYLSVLSNGGLYIAHPDTGKLGKAATDLSPEALAAIKAGKDSVGIYYIGSGSTKDIIQLVSYPSRRDTMIYSKTRHIKVKGNADINHVVRVDYYLLNGKDSLVKYVEEVELKTKE